MTVTVFSGYAAQAAKLAQPAKQAAAKTAGWRIGFLSVD
jgi:hypothetical protein